MPTERKLKVPTWIRRLWEIAESHGVKPTASVTEAMIDAVEWERKRWVYCPKHGAKDMQPIELGSDKGYMCIHIGCGHEVTTERKHWRYAWKVFMPNGEFEFYFHGKRRIAIRDQWLRSKSGPGFFSFPTRKDANAWCDRGKIVRRVRISGITHRGRLRAYVGKLLTETYPNCLLSEWLYIPKERA